MKRDGLTLGWGMAGCSWLAARFAAQRARGAARRRHRARLVRHAGHRHRHVHGARAARAREARRCRSSRVEVVLGDTALPPGPISGGSMATASVDARRAPGGRQRDRLAARSWRRPRRARRSRSAGPRTWPSSAGGCASRPTGRARACRSRTSCAWPGCALVGGSGRGRARSANPRRSSRATRSARTSSR